MDDVLIRPLETLGEMREAVRIQRAVWGDEPEIILHEHMLISIARNGGLVLGAFVNGELAGITIGFLGTDMTDPNRPAMANLKLYSKRLGVLESFRDRQLGYHLKIAQRDYAKKRGIRLITWTFDPLVSRNAYFNVRKLGCYISHFYRDYYGTESPNLALLGSSDRFQADWWVTSRRVDERLEGDRSLLSLRQYLGGGARLVNPTGALGDFAVPGDRFNEPAGVFALVEIPTDYMAIVRQDPALAQAWREHSREVFSGVLGAGFIGTDFVREVHEGRERSFYVFGLERDPAMFSQN